MPLPLPSAWQRSASAWHLPLHRPTQPQPLPPLEPRYSLGNPVEYIYDKPPARPHGPHRRQLSLPASIARILHTPANRTGRRLSRANWSAWRSAVSLNTFEERGADSPRAVPQDMAEASRDRNHLTVGDVSVRTVDRQVVVPKQKLPGGVGVGSDMAVIAGAAAASSGLNVEKPRLRRKLSWRKPPGEDKDKEDSAQMPVFPTSTPGGTRTPTGTGTPALSPMSSPALSTATSASASTPSLTPPLSRPFSPPPRTPSSPRSPTLGGLTISAPRPLPRKQPSITVSPPSGNSSVELRRPLAVPAAPPRIQFSDFGFVRQGPPTPPLQTGPIPQIELNLVNTALEFEFLTLVTKQDAAADKDAPNAKEKSQLATPRDPVKALRRRSLTVS